VSGVRLGHEPGLDRLLDGQESPVFLDDELDLGHLMAASDYETLRIRTDGLVLARRHRQDITQFGSVHSQMNSSKVTVGTVTSS
jgi:hypothetical protein